MPDGSAYPFPTPKAPTGPVCDTPDLRAYVADQYGEPCTDELLAAFFHDETDECRTCGLRFMFDEMTGGRCDECDDERQGRLHNAQRWMDDRGYDR